jgi:hypothetical protein
VLEGRSENGLLGYGLTAVGETGFKTPFFILPSFGKHIWSRIAYDPILLNRELLNNN